MPTLDELDRLARSSRSVLDRLAGEAQSVGQEGIRIREEKVKLEQMIALYDRASAVLNSFAEERQGTAQRQIESLVTRGLQVVFGEELSFHLIADQRAKNPTIEFVVRTTLPDGSMVDTAIMDARGGGLAATVGFLLRIVVLLLRKQSGDQVIVLDETFAHVSDEYTPRLAEFLRELVDKTGVQIILVTHQPIFTESADQVYRFSLGADGATRAVEEG